MFYIYIIYSEKADKFYVGYSENPWVRLEQHQNNTADKFTGKFKDWQLKAVFELSEDRKEAIRIEKFIKSKKAETLSSNSLIPEFKPLANLAQLRRVLPLQN